MKCRIIRGFLIGLLVLWVAGWVGSYQYYYEFCYRNHDYWCVQCLRGEIHLGQGENGWGEKGWSIDTDAAISDSYPEFDSFGFASIPFWFPTTISAALLWLVWWKTRAKVKGRAFPVEVAGKGGKV